MTDWSVPPDSYIEPKILFIPNLVARTLNLTNTPVQGLLDLETMLSVFGVQGTATFVYLNYIYKTESDIFLRHEQIVDFTFYDLMDVYRDQLDKNPTLSDPYTNIVKHIDALNLSAPKLSDSYIRPIDDIELDMEGDNVHYYVPKLEPVGDRIYGIRLIAVTGVGEGSLDKELLDAIVANIGVLSNSYDTKQVATLPYFKTYIRNC